MHERLPSPELLELCHRVAGKIKNYVIKTDDWYGFDFPIDWVRIRIQLILLDMIEESRIIDPPLRKKVRKLYPLNGRGS